MHPQDQLLVSPSFVVGSFWTVWAMTPGGLLLIAAMILLGPFLRCRWERSTESDMRNLYDDIRMQVARPSFFSYPYG